MVMYQNGSMNDNKNKTKKKVGGAKQFLWFEGS
jgi:hypothetical protein